MNFWKNKCFCQHRSCHQRSYVPKGVIKNFAKLTRKQLCQSLFFNKVAGPRPAILLRKRFWHRCFPVSLAKLLLTPFLQNTSGRLLLPALCFSHTSLHTYITLSGNWRFFFSIFFGVCTWTKNKQTAPLLISTKRIFKRKKTLHWHF